MTARRIRLATRHTARAARDERRHWIAPQWRDVEIERDGRGYHITAQPVCTDCGGTISGDDELRAHWRGQHENGGGTNA